MNRLADMAVGGWKLGAIASIHSGFPVTVNSSQFYVVNQRTDRANHFRPMKIIHQSTDAWFGDDASEKFCPSDTDNGVCAYGQESSTGFGTARVGSQRAPKYQGLDMAASKSFAITEGSNLQLRADIFNIFKMVSRGSPNQEADDPHFGQINGTNSTERQIQLALKYTF